MDQETQYTREYIQSLIDGQIPEGPGLEYKSAGFKSDNSNQKFREQLIRQVTAFGNSQGGKLILGIKEVDDIPDADPIPKAALDREQIDQLIHSNVQPAFAGYRIHTIPWDGSGKDTRNIFVIDIDQADTALQALDFKYYKRVNSTTTAMVDFEIRDVMNRNKYPVIEVEFRPEGVGTKGTRPIRAYVYNIYLYFRNTGSVLAQYLLCEVFLPEALFSIQGVKTSWEFPLEPVMVQGSPYRRMTIDNRILDSFHSTVYASESYKPLLPKTTVKLELPIRVEIPIPFDHSQLRNCKGRYRVMADNAPPKDGEWDISALIEH